MNGNVVKAGRVLVMVLATLVIVAQAAASCPPLSATAHAATAGQVQSQDCGEHGPTRDDAATEARRGAVDLDATAPASPVVIAARVRGAGRSTRRCTPRRPSPAGRALLDRLCISRT